MNQLEPEALPYWKLLEKPLWKTGLLFPILSVPPLQRLHFPSPLTSGLTTGPASANLPLLSRRVRSWCFAVQLSSLSHEIRKTPDRALSSAGGPTTRSRGTADLMHRHAGWARNQRSAASAEISGSQHDPPLLRARLPAESECLPTHPASLWCQVKFNFTIPYHVHGTELFEIKQ
uniref:Uncharacterized protein n=1 Tax=Myotis myotis TaxID=51298 RepID=A0A7J7Y0I4_MYOMY|nr:hypothetical protein mMyoMyo1_011376 [Myotis myotis]